MKKIALIVSLIFIGSIGFLIFKPHTALVTPRTEESSSLEASPVVVPPKKSQSTITQVIPTPTPVPVPVKPGVPTPVDTTTYYSAADVRTHASTESCWSIVEGKVYDLTSWITQHPGGSSAIKRMCGIDGTEAFNSQHGGQSRPERELAQFFIGVLR